MLTSLSTMAGLDPAIHRKTSWMAGLNPAMEILGF
jgi:hypothetical protein